MVLATGTRVSGSVTLVRPLGRGGMGSVWVGRHDKLDTDVAVKFVSAELAQRDASALARFKREAALSAKIQSPHVVKIFDHGVMDDGRPYLVMELLRGETLGEYLARHERLSPRHTVTVVSQIAVVLDEAHALGVVHRDIKPDNVFLIDAGYDLFVKVLDFGIAKQTSLPKVSDVTSTGAIVGTPEYMSPEQLLSTKSADHRSDVWSLAVLVYCALLGRVPFTGETLPSLSLSICNADYDPPSTVLLSASEDGSDIPEFTRDLDSWFERALEPDPNRRFQSAGEMAAALRRILTGDSAPPESRPRPGSGRGGVVGDADADPEGETVRRSHLGDGPRAAASERLDIRVSASDDASATRVKGSPSISGAASELVPSAVGQRRRSVVMIGVAIAGAIGVAVTADVLLRRALAPRTTVAAPLSRASGDPWDDDELPSAPPHPSTIVSPSKARAEVVSAPSAATAPSSEASSESSAPPPSDSSRALTTQTARPAATSSATPAICKTNPWELDPDGDLKLRPECRIKH